jgi:hypothetical protein
VILVEILGKKLIEKPVWREICEMFGESLSERLGESFGESVGEKSEVVV